MVKTGTGENRIARIEPFILQLTAAELFAQQVPREFKELHSLLRASAQDVVAGRREGVSLRALLT